MNELIEQLIIEAVRELLSGKVNDLLGEQFILIVLNCQLHAGYPVNFAIFSSNSSMLIGL